MDSNEGQALILIKRIRPSINVPVYQHAGDAGFDLACPLDCVIPANSCFRMPTGLAFALPSGLEMQLRLRSGIAENTPLIMPNAPATIDSGYRGEVFILLRNLSDTDWFIRKGERIAQGVITAFFHAKFEETADLPASERGARGFGSTGRF